MNFRKFLFVFTCIFSCLFLFFGVTILGAYSNNPQDMGDNILPEQSSSTNYFTSLSPELNHPINILVLGGDKVNKNSDTMFLVNIDCKNQKVTLLSIPRDTRVLINGRMNKINYAYPAGGSKLAIKTVSNFLNVNIKYFVYLDSSAFRKIIDIFDGIEYDVPVDMDYDDPIQNLHIHLKKGFQHLDGEKSEQFMRFRHYNRNKINAYYDGSDLKRISAQQNFIKEFLRQKANIKYISKVKDVLDTIYDNIETDISIDLVLKNLSYFSTFDSSIVNMYILPGSPEYIGNISYYLYDRKATYEIIKSYFISEHETISLTDFINYDNYAPKKIVTNNYLTDNPSNSQSSITSSGIEAP